MLASFWWNWSLNSGLCTCKAGTLTLKQHLQSILMGSCELFA
jgi:hypothetical protein